MPQTFKSLFGIWATSIICIFLFSCKEEKKLSVSKQSYQTQELIYTKHALCRMDCRHIDKSEVLEVIALNKINPLKSNSDSHPCPTIAYEGQTHDSQNIRIIIADCDTHDKVVTVIDLDTEWECSCK